MHAWHSSTEKQEERKREREREVVMAAACMPCHDCVCIGRNERAKSVQRGKDAPRVAYSERQREKEGVKRGGRESKERSAKKPGLR